MAIALVSFARQRARPPENTNAKKFNWFIKGRENMNPDLDGRITALTVAVKHLCEHLERKQILSFAEREKLLHDMRHEVEHIPALTGDAPAKRTLGYLWNSAVRP
jgi:hypothetical protein